MTDGEPRIVPIVGSPPPGFSGTPIDRDKILSVGQMRRRARPGVQEGRSHPSTGKPWKSVTNEIGGTVTEHATKDDRVDVSIRVAPIQLSMGLSSPSVKAQKRKG